MSAQKDWWGSGICPFCDTPEGVEYSDVEFEGETLTQEAHCSDCGRDFREVYMLWNADCIADADGDSQPEVLSMEARYYVACEAFVKKMALLDPEARNLLESFHAN